MSQNTTSEKNKRRKSTRTRAREFALQGIYQHLLNGNDSAEIDAFTRDLSGFSKSDAVHYDALFYGCIEKAKQYDEIITPHLDRPLAEVSPIEHAILWLGTYEFQNALDVPWRVVINEYIELSKSFGGTDGHKYVNAILHTLATKFRADEIAADTA